MSAHWTHLNPASKRARGCKDCTDGVPPGDRHWRCRRQLDDLGGRAATRVRLEVAAARRDERARIAEEIECKITEWEPHCSTRYIAGMRAALLYVTGDAHKPLFGAAPDSPALTEGT